MSVPTDLDTFEIKLLEHGVCVIAFNRPKKYNALNPQVYDQWGRALEWAAKSDDVRVVVLTGNGKYFTSGQELTIPDSSELEDGAEAVFKKRSGYTENVVRQLIYFPKLIIAAIQGPVIGFGVTSTAICDVVYTVPEATFNTPFMQLGFCAEACSSVLFPRIMGYSRANEMLLMGRKFTAEEMRDAGMVARIFPKETFMQEVLKAATQAAKYPPEAMKATKKLIRENDCKFLEETNLKEMNLLGQRMASEESANAIIEFMMAKHERKEKAKL
ncbi:Enoyl-CoA delta isomerase 2, mitochondrial [Mortierella sp. GBA35]|nr:Enoyl-CoA delta isomerase 2, mitochondrial [Mortierella sp. GBA35]KAF9092544.1 Enoyl-CoA delta isomerase 2, mitochondrial [Mortierella sp. AD031]KAG0215489.1 Enoyl-CoA delta isomerase 2, mitochondrial [Mortierella sp. NVP41]